MKSITTARHSASPSIYKTPKPCRAYSGEITEPIIPIWQPAHSNCGLESRIDISAWLSDFKAHTQLSLTLAQIEQRAGMKPGSFEEWANPDFVVSRTESLLKLSEFAFQEGFAGRIFGKEDTYMRYTRLYCDIRPLLSAYKKRLRREARTAAKQQTALINAP